MQAEVFKTYKMFIAGSFVRSESGKTLALRNNKGKLLANICDAGRKDLKVAVVAARAAQGAWSNRSAYNRAQILYRMAEMLGARREAFVSEMRLQGYSQTKADKETKACIDSLIYYAGWCDKYLAVSSSVNPVSQNAHCFSVPEPMGVVALVANETSALLQAVCMMAATIAGGNACVVVLPEKFPLSVLSFAEVIATSDLPAGVINLVSGNRNFLATQLSTHLDVNAIVLTDTLNDESKTIESNCAANVKRFRNWSHNLHINGGLHLNYIMDLQEIKTVWHSLEQGISGAGAY